MEKPILFNTEMLKAILEGRKTTTRRIIKRTPSNDEPSGYGFWKSYEERDGKWYIKDYTHSPCWLTLEEYIRRFSKYHVGDIFYVRETWAVCDALDLCSPNGCNIEHQLKENLVWYRADGEQENTATKAGEHLIGRGRWRPSIHMPKEAARIFLKVTDVKVEKLQDMTIKDVLKEGIYNKVFENYFGEMKSKLMFEFFENLWNGTLKKDQLKMYGWDANPYVWVIQFEVVNK